MGGEPEASDMVSSTGTSTDILRSIGPGTDMVLIWWEVLVIDKSQIPSIQSVSHIEQQLSKQYLIHILCLNT